MTLGYSRKLAHFTTSIMCFWFSSNILEKINVKRELDSSFRHTAYMLLICAAQLLCLHSYTDSVIFEAKHQKLSPSECRRLDDGIFPYSKARIHHIQPVINKLISLELPCSTSERKFRVRLQKFESDVKYCIPFVLFIFAFFSAPPLQRWENSFIYFFRSFSFIERRNLYVVSFIISVCRTFFFFAASEFRFLG